MFRLRPIWLVLAPLVICSAARGEDFRIHTKVYQGEESEPVSQNTTLFRAGLVSTLR